MMKIKSLLLLRLLYSAVQSQSFITTTDKSFPLSSAIIYVDKNEVYLLQTAAEILQSFIEKVTGEGITVSHNKIDTR